MARRDQIIEKCDCTLIHHQVVTKVLEVMPATDVFFNLAEKYKILNDATRLKILWLLSENEMCVCDIAYCINMTQSAISHQLRILKQTSFVTNRKEGKIVYYSLKDDDIKKYLTLKEI